MTILAHAIGIGWIPAMTQQQRRRVYLRESPLRDAARRYLSKIDHAEVIKFHGSRYTKAGTPDTLLIWRGLAVWFEWKRHGEKAKKIQEVRMRRSRYCGSPCFVCTTLRDVEAALMCIISERLVELSDRSLGWKHPEPLETEPCTTLTEHR